MKIQKYYRKRDIIYIIFYKMYEKVQKRESEEYEKIIYL